MPAMFVEIITTEQHDPNVITDRRIINYSQEKARRWLSKHTFYALTNGLAVHIGRKW